MKKLSILVAFASLAAASNALSIDLISHGTYQLVNEADGVHYVTSETLDFQDHDVLPDFTSMKIDITDYLPYPLVGTITYTNGTDTLVLDAKFDNLITGGQSQTVNGSWTYDAALSTGAYAGFSDGLGTQAIVLHYSVNRQYTSTTLSGDLNPVVPEPATMTALGLGVLALIRRKRS
ncbi:MAG: PEP-CTERM sorting domain-containing protein [Armatimonadetes bacterium]|nr:PEP-CTERM sorting domain-containing protein [Armatimonadota bacterium]